MVSRNARIYFKKADRACHLIDEKLGAADTCVSQRADQSLCVIAKFRIGFDGDTLDSQAGSVKHVGSQDERMEIPDQFTVHRTKIKIMAPPFSLSLQ